jgi:SulP family sulfate permease
MSHRQDTSTLLRTLKFYLNPNDGRYEDLAKGNLTRNIIKDLTAGLVVAMVAIPLAMGFAMASGLRPEQGIVGGAVAGLLGAYLAAANTRCTAQRRLTFPLLPV